MENIKKYENFLVNEGLESTDTTMVIPSASAKISGNNYDGKGTIFMPAGKYTPNSSNKVKFTIENTSSNTLILTNIKFEEGQLGLGAGGTVLIVGFTAKGPDRSYSLGTGPKHVLSIPPKNKFEFEAMIKFVSKFSYRPGGTPIFNLTMDANVLKGTTTWSKTNGKILIEWGWNDEVSYF